MTLGAPRLANYTHGISSRKVVSSREKSHALQTPASCGKQDRGRGRLLGVDVTTVPNSRTSGTLPPPLFDITDRYTEFDSGPMTLSYAGPIPRELQYSLDTACPPEFALGYVYILGGPLGCIYIGQTYRPGSRLVAHRKKSRFWPHVTHATIYRHVYSGTYPYPEAEMVQIERQLISALVPVFNLERTLAQADRNMPWTERFTARNNEATCRAIALLGKGRLHAED